ncbi:DUF6457 domain-containing protein [Pseudonocardia abyssalis]|uniref:DUF6457 domain-containing protein n=1 Tax=Pseudonocardia abyssalis TaxID=2792008 RepID=A0ABS6USP4_9PSEU|nr:DUF6457 domain-containing protein [Pseudonocardia abyssalis]MBW0117219.1 hypothetical protein [Pseudonocardia abyssalis]MBW0135286.1 hypothetical protein [Pseudonocardia abyssalis]
MPDTRTDEWLTAARTELGLEDAAEGAQGLDAAAELDALVRDNVDGSVAASTVFLLGLAAGRSADPAVAAHDFTEKLSALARSFDADTDRAEAPNDQARRA